MVDDNAPCYTGVPRHIATSWVALPEYIVGYPAILAQS